MDMESCLLCLDIESAVVGIIRVNSIEWETENMKHLIEKHLWSLVSTYQIFASYKNNRFIDKINL